MMALGCVPNAQDVLLIGITIASKKSSDRFRIDS